MRIMRAFHNDSKIKEFYVARVRAHALEYEIVQGRGWWGERGGAVGCTVHSEEFAAYEDEMGIPRQLASLQECIFEGLPHEEAMAFPLAFLTAITVGADLSLVLPHFMVWLLSDPEYGTMRLCPESSKRAIETVVALYQRAIAGHTVAQSEWRSAYDTAYDVVNSADNYDTIRAVVSAIHAVVAINYSIVTEDCADPDGAYGYAAYFSVEDAVNFLTYNTANNADDFNTRCKYYQIMHDKMLELLSSTK